MEVKEFTEEEINTIKESTRWFFSLGLKKPFKTNLSKSEIHNDLTEVKKFIKPSNDE